MVVVAPSSGLSALRAATFLLVGIALLAGAAATARGAARFMRTSQVAPGVVTRLLAGASHPEIRFATPDGRSFTYPQGGLVGGYRAGQAVRVRYLPADPDESASVDRWPAVWGATLLLSLLGGVFSLGGLASVVSAVRR